MTPSHYAHTGLLDLISSAGWMAKFVLFVLLGSSVICWAVIISKWKILKRAQAQNNKFMQIFWTSKNVEEIVTKSEKFTDSPIALVFKQGVKELRKFSSADAGQGAISEKVDNIYRALVRAGNSEMANLEKHLGWLATTASAAPFIGLFGTVWGIMNSFQNIGATGAANLAVVAPGISEALITTATGIAAAIPAVVGYNYFVGQIKKVSVDLECFSQDFINIVQRTFVQSKKG